MHTAYLKHFVDIAELGSVAAAASANYISNQGMSRSLAVLEAELGCQLFRRRGNRLELTDYGIAALPAVREMLACEQALFEAVGAVRERAASEADESVALYLNNVCFDAALFGPLTDGFSRIFQSARYFQGDNDFVAQRLTETGDEMRLGMLCLFSPLREENEGLMARLKDAGIVYRPCLRFHDEVLVSSRSPLAKKRRLSRADILSAPIVSSDGDILKVAESLFGPQSIRMVTSDSSFRFRVVANDEAVTFIPSFYRLVTPSVEPEQFSTVVVPMKDPYYGEVGFAALPDVLECPTVRRMIGRLNASFARVADGVGLTLVTSELADIGLDEDSGTTSSTGVDVLIQSWGLTEREGEVLACLAEPMSVRQASEALGIALPTAKSHQRNIYRKAGVHTRRELDGLIRGGSAEISMS